MLVDWFTVGAQVLNFVILVWLMKRFLYQPILDAIDAREQHIAAELADAEAKRAEARKESDEFQHKNEEFDQQRAELLNKATDEANTERLRLLDEAREAVAVLSAKWRETLKNEERHLHKALIRRTQQEVFAIARKALTDLAGTILEERMVDVFIRRLRELNGEEQARLTSAARASSSPVLVRTTFDLPPELRASTEGAIKEFLGAATQVQFETEPELICGVELSTNGQKVAWSIADYLTALEKSVGELLRGESKPAVPAGPDQKSGTKMPVVSQVAK